jgi:hypothetical protein
MRFLTAERPDGNERFYKKAEISSETFGGARLKAWPLHRLRN